MDCSVFIHLLDQIFPAASIALFLAELPADASVRFWLSLDEMKCAGPVGSTVAAGFGGGTRRIHLLPALNTTFCNTQVHIVKHCHGCHDQTDASARRCYQGQWNSPC